MIRDRTDRMRGFLDWLIESLLRRFFGTLSSDVEGASSGHAEIDRGLFPPDADGLGGTKPEHDTAPKPTERAGEGPGAAPTGDPQDHEERDLWEAAG